MAAILDFKMATIENLFYSISPKLNQLESSFQRLHPHLWGLGIIWTNSERAQVAAILNKSKIQNGCHSPLTFNDILITKPARKIKLVSTPIFVGFRNVMKSILNSSDGSCIEFLKKGLPLAT